MNLKLEELREWVDGESDPERSNVIEAAVKNSADLQDMVASLEASRLPYREAYAAVPFPDMPDTLRQNIDTMVADSGEVQARRNRFPIPLAVAGLVAAAMAGYLFGTVKDQNETIDPATVASINSSADAFESFSQAVASYQALYVRETVEGTVNNNVPAVAARLLEDADLKVQVPDLTAHGYRFVRAQQLSFNGKPLVQLVYLGDTGLPLAFCFMAEDSGASDLVLERHHGLQTAEWSAADKRFVIVSDADNAQLQEMYQSAMKQWQI